MALLRGLLLSWLIIVNTKQPLADAWFPLYTIFFPISTSSRFLPCNYRSPLTGSRIKSFRGTKHGYYGRFALPRTDRADRARRLFNESSIELGKSDLTFVAFPNDLSAALANCNVLARTKLPLLDKSDKSAIRVSRTFSFIRAWKLFALKLLRLILRSFSFYKFRLISLFSSVDYARLWNNNT